MKALRPSYEMKRYTLPQLLRLRAEHEGDRVALREKDYGIWNEITYAQYYENVLLFAHGLLSLGFGPGERLAVIADNIPEWLYAELGAQAVRGISVGVYQSSLPPEIAYMLQYTGASVVLAEDQEQVDKLYEIRSEIPHVRYVIYEDEKGMRGYKDPWLLSFAEVLERGREHRRKHPDAVERLLLGGQPGGGLPPFLHLGHHGASQGGHAPPPQPDPHGGGPPGGGPPPAHGRLPFLPPPRLDRGADDVRGHGPHRGVRRQLPRGGGNRPAGPQGDRPPRDVQPPRVWEGIQSQVWVRISESPWFNRFVYERLLKVGYRAAEYRMRGRPMPLGLRLAYWFADQVLFKPLRDQLGFLRLRRAYTGGAALGPDVFRFFHAIGVNLKQVYGQTEIIGIAFVHRDGDVRHDTVGLPIPGTEVRISEAGEILLRSDAVCAGYWERPEATQETFGDGWLHTGDAGYLTEDGHLVVIDRLSDVMRTEKGTVFSPQFLENKLKFSPYIKEAVVFGDRKPYLAAFINIDPQTVGKWAEDRGLAYTTYLDLSLKPEVAELIRKEVEKVNKELPEELRIQRFVLLYKLLDADDEELTRTGKVRRGHIAKKYAPLVEALYSGAKEVEVEAEYRYQDGTLQRLRARVPVLGFAEEVPA